MNPLNSLKYTLINDFNSLAQKVQTDLSAPKKQSESVELIYPTAIKEYLEAYNQSRIRKRTSEYNTYLKKYEEKKNTPEFKQFEGKDFTYLIKFNREFKKLLDS